MNLGVQLGWHVPRWPRAEREAAIAEIEALGCASIWSAESTGCDAATPLAWAAALTERVRLGAGVLQIPGRSPAMTAMTALGLDRLSDGRLTLGVGASTKAVSEDWHGGDFARQLQRTREYVAVLRQALRGERLRLDGETLTLPRDGPAMRSTDGPVQERIPILLAAIGPRNVALCGEIADGWIATMVAPEHVAEGRERIAAAAADAGRQLPADFAVVVHAMTAIDDDPAVARDAVRPMLAVYAGMGDPRRNLYRRAFDRLGFADEMALVTEHFQAGRVDEARAALPDAFIDTVTLCGTPAQVAERLDAYRAAGVTTVMANLMTDDPSRWRRTLRTLHAATAWG